MTFDEVLALDEAALNAAIEEYCCPCPRPPIFPLAYLRGDAGKYTHFWGLAMPLSRQYGIWSRPRERYDGWEVLVDISLRGPAGTRQQQRFRLFAHSEAEERIARSRLALWAALQTQDRPA